jgi:transcriptional regulator with XRE-family HTH domain
MPLNAASLGDRLRKTRIERSMTLDDVREETGVSVATLSRIERGTASNIKSGTLEALNKWLAWDGETSETPDIVELHLRADKKLDHESADALAQLFRMAYKNLAGNLEKE